MNWLVLFSGVIAAAATIGHFTMGRSTFLAPMLSASFEEVPKKVMHTVFHYISVFQVLSAVALLMIGFDFSFDKDSTLLVWFIAMNYSLFALAGITIALTSNISNGLSKMFQWIFWIAIAVLAWIGA